MLWVIVLLAAILAVLFGILTAIKSGFNEVIAGLEALHQNTAGPTASPPRGPDPPS